MSAATVIIPAWNEAPRIRPVIAAARGCPSVAEVIVVDDGSTDGTAQVAHAAGAHVLRLTRNCGKGVAMAAGLDHTQTPDACFLDADLTGLTAADVGRLIGPVQAGAAAMTIAQTRGVFMPLLAYIGGQRAVRLPLPPGTVDRLSRSGWGAEIILTRSVRSAGGKIVVVPMPNVGHAQKMKKRSLVGAFTGFFGSGAQCLAAMAGW